MNLSTERPRDGRVTFPGGKNAAESWSQDLAVETVFVNYGELRVNCGSLKYREDQSGLTSVAKGIIPAGRSQTRQAIAAHISEADKWRIKAG